MATNLILDYIILNLRQMNETRCKIL